MHTRVIDLCHRNNLSFKRLNMTSRALCAVLAISGTLAVAQPATAATLLVNTSGELTGATGINVEGTLYDVSFVDGTCAELSLGCDASTFTTVPSATAAAQALIDQVFLETFDTDPSLTFGCESPFLCWAITPYAAGDFSGLAVFFSAIAINSAGTSADFVHVQPFQRNVDLRGETFVVYADWAPAATAAPEPALMLLLGTGLVGAGLRRWRQKRA